MPAVKNIPIDLDKPRSLRLDLNAMEQFEEVSGKSIAEISGRIKDIKILLWAMLLHEDPELTLEQVGAMVGAENIVTIRNKIDTAARMASPKSNGKKRANPTNAQTG